MVVPLEVPPSPSGSLEVDVVGSRGAGDLARGDSRPEVEPVGELRSRGVLGRKSLGSEKHQVKG